ncbi:restriction endonuclease subunit S [Rugosimonospora acidiphila]|uniref:restriction endonuclease subunit S n=1 Tax=Rugosimonospora acidiphila TaxID=556531 RepID=UPI0031F0C229
MTVNIAPWLTSSHWPTVPIRYVARLGTGHTPSRQHPEYWENCTIPWVTLADVGQLRDGTVDTISGTAEMISPLGVANSAAVQHPAGTVILSRTASVGFSAVLGTDMATSQDYATWTCGPRLDPKYLLHALRAMAPDLRRLATGSTHKTIYMPDIAELRIPLPPLAEQRRIADFLDAETVRIDTLVDLVKRAIKLLEARRRLHVLDLIEPVRDNVARPTVALKYLSSSLSVGIVITPARWYVDGDGVVALRGLNIRPGRISIDDIVRISQEGHTLHAKSKLRAGDVVVVRTGQTGVAAVVPKSLDGSNCIDLVIVRPISTVVPQYIEIVLNSDFARQYINEFSVGTIQSHLNVAALKQLPIPERDPTEQLAVVEAVGQIDREVDGAQSLMTRQIELLTERRQALITAAVTGQFDVTTARGADLS